MFSQIAVVNAEVEKNTAEFVKRVNVKMVEYYAATFPEGHVKPEPLAAQVGGFKFTRIVCTDSLTGKPTRVYCFIDKANGDILKADGYKKPAKHARGSVMVEDFGVSKVGPYGPHYMGGEAACRFTA